MVVKEPKKISVGIVLSWIIGIVFVLGGFGALFSKELIGAFTLFIMGSILIPPLNRLISNKIKFELSSKRIKALVIVIGFVVIAVFIDTEDTTPSIQETANQQEISTQPSIAQEKSVDKETTTNKLLTKQQNIFYYDILSNKSIQITNNILDEKYPDIYKNKIVWSDNRNGKLNYDIYLYDLDTKKETQITSQQDTNELYPSIYGDYVVYLKSGKEYLSV